MLEQQNTKADWFDQVADPGQSEMAYNKTEFNKQEVKRLELEQQERTRLKDNAVERDRRMNIATHRLKISRNFDEF